MANQRRQDPDSEKSQKPNSLYDAQRRRTLAQAKQEELAAAEMEGKLVKIEQVQAIWERVATAIKAKLLGLPTKVAPLVTAAKTVTEVQSILKKQIHEALDELSRLRFDAAGPTARPHRERVGRSAPPTEPGK